VITEHTPVPRLWGQIDTDPLRLSSSVIIYSIYFCTGFEAIQIRGAFMTHRPNSNAEAPISGTGSRKRWDVPRVMELTTKRDVKSGGPGKEQDNTGSGSAS
jgi:hypothetical protein